MNTILRLNIAFIAILISPLSSEAGETRQWVRHYDEHPRLVASSYGWYDIEQSSAVGWLYSDGTFEEHYRDPRDGIYTIYQDYSEAWDFATWRTGKYVVSAEHGTNFPGFMTTSLYLYNGAYYVGLRTHGYDNQQRHADPIWSTYHNAAWDYYQLYSSQGHYNLGVACYYYYYCLGDYYLHWDSGDYPAAYYSYYTGMAMYYLYYFQELGDYESANSYYDYYSEFSHSYL